MGDYVLYQALQNYTPYEDENNALEFRKDDVFDVQSSFIENGKQRKGWLWAYNRRTAEEGYIPVESVKLLGSKVNNTIHHPSAPGVEASHTSSAVVKTIPSDVKLGSFNHQLTDVYFHTPGLCIHCRDYIWGSGKVGMQCMDLQTPITT